MSVTPNFEDAFLNLFSQKSITSEYYLMPVNTMVLQDANGNTVATVTDVEVSYTSGVLTIQAEFESPVQDTITTAIVGSTYQGVFTPYFTAGNLSFSVTQSNFYEITVTITLNNATLQLSPFQSATLDVNKLMDIVGNVLANNPLYVGKKGHFFDAIYVVNTTSNVSQSFSIPITILSIQAGVLYIGGITPSTVSGNQIVLRDNNQNDLISVLSSSVITVKSGRQIVFEISF
jgi:hypothetical protein